MVIVIIDQVVATWDMRLSRKVTYYSVYPQSCILGDNFKFINMGVYVVKSILRISHSYPYITIIACWREPKGTEEISKQGHESFGTCSESIESTDNESNTACSTSKFCANFRVYFLLVICLNKSITNVITFLDLVHQQLSIGVLQILFPKQQPS